MKKEGEGFSIFLLVFKGLDWVLETGSLGPKFIPLNIMVNLQKLGTPFYIAFLMYYYQNYSQAIWIYMGFHGAYGIAWQIKDSVFPDKRIQAKVNCATVFILYSLILAPYCVGSWLIATNNTWQDIPYERITLATYIFALGYLLVFCADCQKYYILQLKKGLIDNGFFKYCRNPNYLGQIMLYFSFALLVNHPLFYAINIFAWCTLFMSQMAGKDLSFSKKEGWEQYKQRSWQLLFKINGNAVLSFFVYAALGGAIGYAIHQTGGMKVIPSQFLV